jgi:hypothetical protein
MSEELKSAQEVKETATAKKARIAQEKADAKAEKVEAKAVKVKEKADAKALAKANKPAGVIASILEFVKESKTPISQDSVLDALCDRFPTRDRTSMNKTVKAQLGGKAQPTRIEKEKKVVLVITYTQVEETVKGKEGEADQVNTVNGKEKLYLYKGEATE